MHDLVIRGATVVDGTAGAQAFRADLAVDDGRITEIGEVRDDAREVIEADGLLVTPGFVDVHTHYDGQVTWDPMLTPSSWHGVTTLLMGNCGVGFAPVTAERREWLIGLMEGVEDIPGTALSRRHPLGVGDLPRVPRRARHHAARTRRRRAGAARRGARLRHGRARRAQRARDARRHRGDGRASSPRRSTPARSGVTTSRTIVHRAVDGEPVPGTFAAEDELFALGRALADVGRGVFELAPAGIQGEDMSAPDKELDWMRRLAEETQRPVTYGFVQHDVAPDDWKRLLDLAARRPTTTCRCDPRCRVARSGC